MNVPNWCRNEMIVSGSKEILEDFAAKFKGYPVDWNNTLKEKFITKGPQECFNALYPVPDIVIQQGYSRCSGEHVVDGFKWCNRNWGTKWDIYDSVETEKFDDKIIYNFSTAWRPPTAWVKYVSKLFPTLQFLLKYLEEGCMFVGCEEIENGSIIDEDTVVYSGDNYDLYKNTAYDLFAIDVAEEY